jgi:hypothetical protein
MSVAVQATTEFKALHVTRRNDAASAHAADSLFVDRDMRAWVQRASGDIHHFELDSTQAQELVSAMHTLASKPSVRPSGLATPPVHDLELVWNGEHLRFHDSHLATDEALHGAIDVSSKLIDASHEHGTKWVRPLAAETRGAHDTGVVPPWLEGQSVAPAMIDPETGKPLQPADPDAPHIMHADMIDPATGKPLQPADPDAPHIMGGAATETLGMHVATTTAPAPKWDPRFAAQLQDARASVQRAHDAVLSAGPDAPKDLRAARSAVRELRDLMRTWDDIPNDLLDTIDTVMHDAQAAADAWKAQREAGPGTKPVVDETAQHLLAARTALDTLLGA